MSVNNFTPKFRGAGRGAAGEMRRGVWGREWAKMGRRGRSGESGWRGEGASGKDEGIWNIRATHLAL